MQQRIGWRQKSGTSKGRSRQESNLGRAANALAQYVCTLTMGFLALTVF